MPAIAAVPLALVISGIYVAGVQTSFEALDLWLPLAIPMLVQLPLALFVCGALLWVMLKVEDTRYFLVPGMLAAFLYLLFNQRMNRAYVSTLLTTLKEKLFLPDERMYAELQGGSEATLQELRRGVGHAESNVAIAFARALVEAFPAQAADITLYDANEVPVGEAGEIARVSAQTRQADDGQFVAGAMIGDALAALALARARLVGAVAGGQVGGLGALHEGSSGGSLA